MSVIAALTQHHKRLMENGKVGVDGYTMERISYCLVLSVDGTVLSILDLRPDGKTASVKAVPASRQRSGKTPQPFFLWDNTKHVLGLTFNKKEKSIEEAPRNRQSFIELHQKALVDTSDEGLLAFLGFLDKGLPEHLKDPAVLKPMLDTNLVFMLDGDTNATSQPRFLHERPAALALWAILSAERVGETGTCLVSGEVGPIARIHPVIKGVSGAQSTGAALVSFNSSAFESYGLSQGLISPISEATAAAYGASLNHLLSHKSGCKVLIGDTTTVFWADASNVGEDSAAASEVAIEAFMGNAVPDDEQEVEKIRAALIDIAKGRASIVDIEPNVTPETQCYILGLSPASARLSVRYWETGTFERFSAAIERHYRDLYVEPYPWKTGPNAWSLLYEVAPQRKMENVPPRLGGDLLRAILTRGRYPRTILHAAITRIHADGNVSGRRVAIIKAYLQRESRIKGGEEEDRMSLDKNDETPSYRLGRLFAVLESIQYQSQGKLNSTIRDRFFS